MEADRSMHAASKPAWARRWRVLGLKGSGGNGGVGVGVTLCWQEGQFLLSLSHSFCFVLKIEFSGDEEGSTQLGFPYLLTQVMVLHTGTIWEPNAGSVCRAGPPGEAGSSQPIVLYQWTRLIPVISCQRRALSSLVLSAQIKLMKCNPLKCPGCISVTGLRTREGRHGGPAPRQGNIPPLPNLGFKSTLINPLIQHIFDSQLMRMRSG